MRVFQFRRDTWTVEPTSIRREVDCFGSHQVWFVRQGDGLRVPGWIPLELDRLTQDDLQAALGAALAPPVFYRSNPEDGEWYEIARRQAGDGGEPIGRLTAAEVQHELVTRFQLDHRMGDMVLAHARHRPAEG